jgi:hypothetical protein
MSCVKTLFELAMLVRTMAKKAFTIIPLILLRTSIGYGSVCSIMADTKVSKASLD